MASKAKSKTMMIAGPEVVRNHETIVGGAVYNFTWRITNVDSIIAMHYGDRIQSPKFITDYGSHKLILYPKGWKWWFHDIDYMALHLASDSKNESRPVHVTIALVHKTKKTKNIYRSCLFRNRMTRRWFSFVPITNLYNDFVKDICEGGCMMFYLKLRYITSEQYLYAPPASIHLDEFVGDNGLEGYKYEFKNVATGQIHSIGFVGSDTFVDEDAIIQRIDTFNIGSIFLMVDQLNATKIRKAAIEFVALNRDELAIDEKFHDVLTLMKPDLLAELLVVMMKS